MAFSSGYQRFVREQGRTLRIWIRRWRWAFQRGEDPRVARIRTAQARLMAAIG
jgi:hypothetical protein